MKLCKLILLNFQINHVDYNQLGSRTFCVNLAERDQTLNVKPAIIIQHCGMIEKIPCERVN